MIPFHLLLNQYSCQRSLIVCLEKQKVYTMPYNNPLLSQKIKKFLTSGDWFQSQRFLWAVPWCRSSVCIATKLKRESKVLWRGDRTPVCFSPSVSNKPLKFWCIWSHASKVFSTPTFFKEQCIYRTTTNKQIAAATRVHRLLCGWWDPSRNLEWCFGLVEKPKTLVVLHTDSSPLLLLLLYNQASSECSTWQYFCFPMRKSLLCICL